ncbi:MAG: LapA family protein [Chloroflexota bacterium]
MITILLILALLISVIAVIFALQNTTAVSVSFFIWQFEQSLALVLLLTALAGVLIGLLTILPGMIRTRWQLASRNKKVSQLEKEMTETKIKLEAANQRIATLEKPALPVTPPPPAVESQPADTTTPPTSS